MIWMIKSTLFPLRKVPASLPRSEAVVLSIHMQRQTNVYTVYLGHASEVRVTAIYETMQ